MVPGPQGSWAGPLSFLSFSSWAHLKGRHHSQVLELPARCPSLSLCHRGPVPSILSEKAEHASTVLGLPLIPLDVGVPLLLLSISLSSVESRGHHSLEAVLTDSMIRFLLLVF